MSMMGGDSVPYVARRQAPCVPHMALSSNYAPWMAQPHDDKTHPQEILATNFERFRKRGIKARSLDDIAAKSGEFQAKKSNLKRVEDGSGNPTLNTIAGAAKGVGTPVWTLFYPNYDPDDPPVLLSQSQVEALEAWKAAQEEMAKRLTPEAPQSPKAVDALSMPAAQHERVLKAFYDTKKPSIRALIKERTLFDAEFAERNKDALKDGPEGE